MDNTFKTSRFGTVAPVARQTGESPSPTREARSLRFAISDTKNCGRLTGRIALGTQQTIFSVQSLKNLSNEMKFGAIFVVFFENVDKMNINVKNKLERCADALQSIGRREMEPPMVYACPLLASTAVRGKNDSRMADCAVASLGMRGFGLQPSVSGHSVKVERTKGGSRGRMALAEPKRVSGRVFRKNNIMLNIN